MGGPFTNVPGAINIPGTSFNNTGLTNGTTYYYVVSATNATGEGPNSSPAVPATPSAATWTSQDIGAVATAGSWNLNAGVHTVVGNGADIWTAADEFRFTYQTLTGDGTITARLTAFTGTGTINANAKAGVMIRQSLTAGSPHLLSCLPVQGQATLIKQIRRLTSGATSLSTSGAAPAFPRWVRVTRTGTLAVYLRVDQRHELDPGGHRADHQHAGRDGLLRHGGDQPRGRHQLHGDVRQRDHHRGRAAPGARPATVHGRQRTVPGQLERLGGRHQLHGQALHHHVAAATRSSRRTSPG